MGNVTLGNTAGGNSVQYWYQDTANGVSVLSGDSLNITEEAYIDQIFVFGNSESSNAGSCRAGLYTLGAGTLFGQTNTFTMGTSTTWWHGSFSAGSYLHFPAANTIRGAVLESGGGGFRTWGRGDGGSWVYKTNVSSLSAPYSGTTQGGLGNWPWYVTYFKAATITGYKSTSGSTTTSFVGDRLEIDGVSYTAGITSITFNGTAADLGTLNTVSDTHINITVPAGASTGPVVVATNAGTATGGTLIIASAYVFRSSVWTTAPVNVERSGVETQAQGVLVYRSGAWVNAS